jgi:hypothetical protein
MPEEMIIEKEPEIIPSRAAAAVQPNRHYFYQGKDVLFYGNNNN